MSAQLQLHGGPRRSPFVTFALFAMSVLLAGCAQQPRRDQPPAAQRATREAIMQYSLEGRVSVTRGNEARQAGISWRHDGRQGGQDRIELSGPLGQKAALLSRDAGGARLETSAHQIFTAPDWEGLAEQAIGISLPLNGMAQWVTATFGATAQVEHDALGRPLHALVQGWQIDYLGYESELPDALPVLIKLHRDDIDVRLKIDEWQID